MLMVRVTKRSASAARRAFGRLDMPSMPAARFWKVHSSTCRARKAGSPISVKAAASSGGVMPSREAGGWGWDTRRVLTPSARLFKLMDPADARERARTRLLSFRRAGCKGWPAAPQDERHP